MVKAGDTGTAVFKKEEVEASGTIVHRAPAEPAQEATKGSTKGSTKGEQDDGKKGCKGQ